MGDKNVLPFSRPGNPIERLGAVIARPSPNMSVDGLLALYGEAIGDSELPPDRRGQLEMLFSGPRTIRILVKKHGARRGTPPLALALASPVPAPQDLAESLVVNYMDHHAYVSVTNGRCWALLLAVDPGSRRQGLGRALANVALEDMLLVGCDRVFLTARARDAWMQAKLIGLGFGRGGLTIEEHPRVLYSRSPAFVF